MKILQPPTWAAAKGYANGVAAEGRLVFVAGQIGWNPESQRFEHSDVVGQFRQALQNIVAVLAEAGGRAEHLVRLTWFLTDRDAYRANLTGLGEAYRAVIGRHYPAMSVVAVSALVEDRALLEIEATAVIPPE